MRGVTFRAGAGIVVTNAQGLVLACERDGMPGAWQMPQGGLEADEEPLAAAMRELEEETGIPMDAVRLLDTHPDWLAYELPPERRRPDLGRGQVQRWFLFRLEANDSVINLTAATAKEFTAWRWMRLADLIECAMPFRRATYLKLAARFAAHLAQ